MASEDLVQLLARAEAVDLKRAEVMHLVTVATVGSLASGEIVPGDPEFAATAARGEAMALEVIRSAADSVAMFARKAAEYAAAAPGGSGEAVAVAEAIRRQAASSAALAEKFAAFMRRAAALPLPAAGVHSESDSDSSSDVPARPATARPRRRNARYFGPEWSN
ncbi:unnamed protein product [Urochloa decumbens]|uniref:Uncharacterized protein n=1 Tax=Urochloa decumbens TaxID=240449 RepID=A0ABC9BVB5_9POAL